MSDVTLKESNSSEEMVEFENQLNGEIYLIRVAEKGVGVETRADEANARHRAFILVHPSGKSSGRPG